MDKNKGTLIKAEADEKYPAFKIDLNCGTKLIREFREAFHIRIVLMLKAMQFQPPVLRMRDEVICPGSLLLMEPGWNSGIFLQCCPNHAFVFCTLQTPSKVLSETDV